LRETIMTALPMHEEPFSSTLHGVVPIVSGSARSGVATALSAISAAAGAAAASETQAAIDDLFDELAPLLTRPITMHQRDVLGARLVDLIDARVAAALLR
jgi:hypothetical protein